MTERTQAERLAIRAITTSVQTLYDAGWLRGEVVALINKALEPPIIETNPTNTN